MNAASQAMESQNLASSNCPFPKHFWNSCRDSNRDVIDGLRPEHLTIRDREVPDSIRYEVRAYEHLGSEIIMDPKVKV